MLLIFLLLSKASIPAADIASIFYLNFLFSLSLSSFYLINYSKSRLDFLRSPSILSSSGIKICSFCYDNCFINAGSFFKRFDGWLTIYEESLRDDNETSHEFLCFKVDFLIKFCLLNPLIGSVVFLIGSNSYKGAI